MEQHTAAHSSGSANNPDFQQEEKLSMKTVKLTLRIHQQVKKKKYLLLPQNSVSNLFLTRFLRQKGFLVRRDKAETAKVTKVQLRSREERKPKEEETLLNHRWDLQGREMASGILTQDYNFHLSACCDCVLMLTSDVLLMYNSLEMSLLHHQTKVSQMMCRRTQLQKSLRTYCRMLSRFLPVH